ncbi:lipoyl(octanoyl) transferase LipB [Acidipila sp. EB88]|uniref:lipoyl(octanoyl) transferase LipB n=1 Tax=Acidipila sp. EB88 TaxID=2305226 RepID=UPI000F5FAEA7|nr:lipoyl(octanoyl) transferase LipB [Acidipila sp. EB88]RRA48161.1 lipoyl(octanoyl) transferase LipB [Acidipila sp. EB88]
MSDVLTLLTPGRVDYPRALHLQEQLVELRRTGAIGDVLVLLEHPPVLTLGRNADRTFITASEAELAARGVALHVVKRGGDVTYHGPGQLVGYPILDLRTHFLETGARMGVVDCVRRLEEVLIRVAGEYGVRAMRVPGRTGVWTIPGGSIPEKKLAAIGMHVSRGITSHGFALNVSTDLRDFALIVPCGIADRTVTNLADEADEASFGTTTSINKGASQPAPLSVASVGLNVARMFGRIFERQVLALDAPAELHPTLANW